MTTVDSDDYYLVARKLIEASRTLETDLLDLDDGLDISRSAGLYPYGGPQWAKSFDQSLSDAFEAGGLGAIAARELGYLIHLGGNNLDVSENNSHNGPRFDPPKPPNGASLTTSPPISQLSVGGDEENPTFWSLVDDFVTKVWADCDEARIGTVGDQLNTYGTKKNQLANTLYTEVTGAFPEAAQAEDPVLDAYVDDVANVCTAIAATADAATYLSFACKGVAETAKSAKDDCRTSLRLLAAIVASYEADKIPTYILPGGSRMRRNLDRAIEMNKRAYAAVIDARLGNIETKVTEAVGSNTGIYGMVTEGTRVLSSILDRTPRNTDPVKFRDEQQNKAAGDEGERRAGIDPYGPKRKVFVDVTMPDGTIQTQGIIPDRIDDDTQQVTEVKNTNEINPDKQQILAETQWAKENGYTMTLIVDHRTQINSPEIQALIDSGQIQLIRKELDDNNDR
ncbi:putative toxin [Nocardia amikacinitolerans]|uniref:putative toxin n=1 Tax=Nocardia amikacinitolerans TaxID=756689 RepID=UPI003689BA88